MNRLILTVLLLPISSLADDPFSCVDPDVADAFLGDSRRGRGEYSTYIPDGFVTTNTPRAFSLVGSQKLNSATTVVYTSDMTADASLGAAVVALAELGWTENEQRYRAVSGGFQTTSRPASILMCHDDYSGALSVIAADKEGRTFVSYAQRPTSQSCGATEPARIGHDPSEMMRLVPTLSMPDGVKAKSGGMGGNGHEVNSRVDISESTGRSDLMSFFENQIRDQKWEFQTSWSSHHSSGSVWTLYTEEDGLLVGTLHLYDSGIDPIRVRFSVTPTDPTKGTNSGGWSGSSN